MFTIQSYILVHKPDPNQNWYSLFECNPKKYFVILKDDQYSKTRYNSINVSSYYLNEGEGCVIIKYYDEYLLSYSDFGTLDSFWNNIVTMIKFFVSHFSDQGSIGRLYEATLPETAVNIKISKVSETSLLFHKRVGSIIQVAESQRNVVRKITELTCELPSKEFLIILLDAAINFCQIGKKYFLEDYSWILDEAVELKDKINKVILEN